jgi:type VI secretion system protein VasD
MKFNEFQYPGALCMNIPSSAQFKTLSLPPLSPTPAVDAPQAAPRRDCLAWGLGAAALVGLGLAGCAGAPKPVISSLQVNATAAADVNPDVRRRASPVTVRLYAMKSAAPFESADFFSLFDKDTATLGADLVQREEMLLKPGEQKAMALKFGPEVKVIAVMAAFRDLERARWRAVHTVSVGTATDLAIKLSGTQVVLEATPTPKK